MTSEQQHVAASVAIHHFAGPRPAGKRGGGGMKRARPGEEFCFGGVRDKNAGGPDIIFRLLLSLCHVR